MKKLLMTTALAFGLVVTPAMADFYNKQVGNWLVFGFEGTPDNNRACVIQYEWRDGSRFHLIKDMVDGEAYIWFKNNQWNIGDAPGNYEGMTIIVEGSNGTVKSWNAIYNLMNKNTIIIRNLQNNPDFIEAFSSLSVMKFVMPGDIENVTIPLAGSSAAIIAGSDCINASNAKKKSGTTL